MNSNVQTHEAPFTATTVGSEHEFQLLQKLALRKMCSVLRISHDVPNVKSLRVIIFYHDKAACGEILRALQHHRIRAKRARVTRLSSTG